MMHLTRVTLNPERYPTRERYPFNLPILQQTREVVFPTPVTLFVGENGTGKSTLLQAMARACRIPIWADADLTRLEHNPYARALQRYLAVTWAAAPVPGSYFSSQLFREFTAMVEEFAANDPGQLRYFGGKSLLTQSHGQSLMSYFRARYTITGLYFLDEPETALSPTSQVALVRLMAEMAAAGHAQFILCTHSPILMACPGATIYSFDHVPVTPIAYAEIEHVRVYREFLADPESYLG
jgi:predicted ATPase